MGLRVAILGATGLVGQEMLSTLRRRGFPADSIKLLSSGRSAGSTIESENGPLPVGEAGPESFAGVDLVLSSAGERVSADLVPHAVRHGAVVIDNTAEFRMRPDVPLVIPEINPQALSGHRGIIANPNCSTAIVLMALAPLRELALLRRVVVSTYQSVSGAGTDGVKELEGQLIANSGDKRTLLDQPSPRMFSRPIAFNVIPAIGRFADNGYTQEELKMIFEARKILSMPDLAVSCTCVRVPVRVGHCAAVNVELDQRLTLAQVRECLRRAPGVALVDEPENGLFPVPLDVAGRDEVQIGRLRHDLSHETGISFWVAGDNLRKGAALNAVQIAERLVQDNLLAGWHTRTVSLS